ncbi:MAG: sigma-70 family RNA polymerase sigma factor [Gemmatimonadota bacterium]|nr:sigma-70 family RNA polymerase sigma factor [Gemmatimonadota bacterium]
MTQLPKKTQSDATAAPLSGVSREEQRDRDREFAEIALPLLPTIARVANALTRDEADADDLVQDTFLQGYRHWRTFAVGTDCRRWLTTICRNEFFRRRRRERRTVSVDDDELELLGAARAHIQARDAGVDDMFTQLDVGPAIMSAIAALPSVFKGVVVLSDVEGFTYEEIAEMLDLPIGTVRSRLYRGRRRLQDSLLSYALDAGIARPATNSPPSGKE